ncbi:membrane-bound alpha-1,6- mannosyltransferase Initiation-specific [Nowakowskiella sp. JEL0407]|nr:membrane-bound alpha-1,6- mannosyltransferase Initiation-specific [Nowakowskiella sp. JEL0407]
MKASGNFTYIHGTTIPRIIHQTCTRETLRNITIQKNIESFKTLNRNYLHFLWVDDDVRELVELYFPAHYLTIFDQLPKPVMKADIFRYMVLYQFGGVYSDIDTVALQSVDDWLFSRFRSRPNAEDQPKELLALVVGMEADVVDRSDWFKWYARPLQWCQWTIVGSAKHPVLKSVTDSIFIKVGGVFDGLLGDVTGGMVLEITGPGIWTDTFNLYLQSMGVYWWNFIGLEEPFQVKDTLLLPVTSFSPGVGSMGSEGILNPRSFVYHQFNGSWN